MWIIKWISFFSLSLRRANIIFAGVNMVEKRVSWSIHNNFQELFSTVLMAFIDDGFDDDRRSASKENELSYVESSEINRNNGILSE